MPTVSILPSCDKALLADYTQNGNLKLFKASEMPIYVLKICGTRIFGACARLDHNSMSCPKRYLDEDYESSLASHMSGDHCEIS